jgi:hypothetical protein
MYGMKRRIRKLSQLVGIPEQFGGNEKENVTNNREIVTFFGNLSQVFRFAVLLEFWDLSYKFEQNTRFLLGFWVKS